MKTVGTCWNKNRVKPSRPGISEEVFSSLHHAETSIMDIASKHAEACMPHTLLWRFTRSLAELCEWSLFFARLLTHAPTSFEGIESASTLVSPAGFCMDNNIPK